MPTRDQQEESIASGSDRAASINQDSASERSDTPSSSSSRVFGSVVDDADVQERDVLCGRDRYIHAHPGNRRFRHLVHMFREQYQGAQHRDTKTSITLEIVDMVKGYGGRFLKQDNGRWREVDRSYAHEKVSHALRSAKDPNRPPQRRTRNVVIRPPSEEEERFFQVVAEDQYRIYQGLRKNRKDSLINFEGRI